MKSTNYQPLTKRGFTLIELLLYVSISAVLLLVISIFLASLLQSRVKNQTIAEVEQQGAAVLQLVTQTIRNADTVNTPAQGLNATTLSLDTYTGGENPTVFDISNGIFYVTKGSGPTIPLTNARVSASGLFFNNLSRMNTPGTLRIQFTLNSVNSDGREEFSFTKTFISSASLRHP